MTRAPSALYTPPPRPVCLDGWGWRRLAENITFFVISAPLCAGLAYTCYTLLSGWLLGLALGFALIAVLCAAGLVNLLLWHLPRERQLLKHGELVLAIVTGLDAAGRVPALLYEYRDFLGVMHRERTYASAADAASPPEAIAVFFDRNRPKRHVVYASAYHRIAGDAPR